MTQADPFDMGGGRVQVDQGAQSGLLFNVAAGAFQAANPSSGGDPKTLNLASLGNDDCGGSCSWTRTVEAVDDGAWVVTTSAPAGMTLTVSPTNFALNAGQTQVLNITANVGALPLGVWAFGEVTLTPGVPIEGGGFAAQHLPVAVKPSSSTPVIDVNPGSLSSTQAPNTSNVEVLNVGNTGTADLTWNIFEDNAAAPELLNWSENFDSYATGSQLIGQGGWEGWDGERGSRRVDERRSGAQRPQLRRHRHGHRSGASVQWLHQRRLELRYLGLRAGRFQRQFLLHPAEYLCPTGDEQLVDPGPLQ